VKKINTFKILPAVLLFFSCSVSAAPILYIGDAFGNLGTVDVATGDVSVIGRMPAVMTDIAFDPNGNLYGITFTGLYSINRTTAAATFIGNTGISSNSLVFDSSGNLYTANNSLYSINTTTGSASRIGNGGAAYNSSGDLAFIGGELFLSSGSGGVDSLVKINTSNGAGTVVGSTGFSAVYGLATDNNVNLYGVAGTTVLSINALTGSGAALVNYGGKGLISANGSAYATEAVPIPAAMWLFGSGLLGLIGIARKKMK
jgi:hypothetical protein